MCWPPAGCWCRRPYSRTLDSIHVRHPMPIRRRCACTSSMVSSPVCKTLVVSTSQTKLKLYSPQQPSSRAAEQARSGRIAPSQARPGLQDKCAASKSQLSLFSFIWQTSAPVIDDNLFVVHELRAASSVSWELSPATPHWRRLWLPVRHKVWPEISGQQGVCAMRQIYFPQRPLFEC